MLLSQARRLFTGKSDEWFCSPFVPQKGRVKLIKEADQLLLTSDDPSFLAEIKHHRHLKPYILGRLQGSGVIIDAAQRDHVKQALVQFGYTAEDPAGHLCVVALDIQLLKRSLPGNSPFGLRGYQQEA